MSRLSTLDSTPKATYCQFKRYFVPLESTYTPYKRLLIPESLCAYNEESVHHAQNRGIIDSCLLCHHANTMPDCHAMNLYIISH